MRTTSNLMANLELSRLPGKERIHMPAPTTTQSWLRTRDSVRIHIAFRLGQQRRRSGLKTFAALLVGLCTPRPTLRPRSRDRRRTAWGRYGSLNLVSSKTFTPYSLPVSPAHLPGFSPVVPGRFAPSASSNPRPQASAGNVAAYSRYDKSRAPMARRRNCALLGRHQQLE